MTILRFLRRPSHILGGLLAVMLVFTGCGNENGIGDDTPDDDETYTVERDIDDPEVAAIVSSDYGTDTMRTTEFQQQMQFAMQSMPPDQQSGDQMAELHRMMLDQYVSDHVLRGEATARGVEADEAMVDQQLEQQRSQFPSEEEFQEALDGAGITIDSLRSMVAERVKVQQLRDELSADAADEPTDQEVEEYGMQHRNLSARHILLQVDENAGAEAEQDARQRAQDLIDRLNDGADFEELAEEYSEGPTADRGGDLGYFTRDRMVEPFADAVFELEEDGDIVQEPVRTQFGFHVIQLTDYGEPMDPEQARQALMQDQEQEAYETAVNDLMRQATVRVNPEIITLPNGEDTADMEDMQ